MSAQVVLMTIITITVQIDEDDAFFTGGRLAYVFLPLCAGLGNGTIVLDNEKV
jgi:hypothetical protein